MTDPRVAALLAGLDLAVDDVQAHPTLSGGVRGRHLFLALDAELNALACAASDLRTRLVLRELDPPPPSMTDLVCYAARLRHCRLDSHPTLVPVVVESAAVREMLDRAATRTSLRADAAMVDVMERRGLPHYVHQSEQAALHAIQVLDGHTWGGPSAAVAALNDAIDYGLVSLAAIKASYLPTGSQLGHTNGPAGHRNDSMP